MNNPCRLKLLASVLVVCVAPSSLQAEELAAQAEILPTPYSVEVENSRVNLAPRDLDLDGRGDESRQIVVTIITLDGVSRQYRPDANGRITIENLPPGPVGIVATAPLLHAATLVYIREADAGQARRVKLPLMRIAPDVVLKHVRGYLQPDLGEPVRAAGQYEPLEAPLTNETDPYTVRLQGDGSLRGRLAPILPDGAPGSNMEGMNITLLSPSGEPMRAISDAEGYFSWPRVTPGTYGVIAAGPGGYAAHALEVLPAITPAPAAVTPVSMRMNQPGGGGMMSVVPLPPPMIPSLIEVIETNYSELPPGELPPPPPGPPGFAGGGFGPGGGFGGGGGGSGTGGLGSLAALAPLALIPIIADELDDDDDEIFAPQPTSPAIVSP